MTDSFSFFVVTDTHYFDSSLSASGTKYDEYMKTQQMCLAENSAIVKATFAEIARDRDTDIVLIPGDLTKDGEKASHIGFIDELKKLRKAGKRIYVITARHDFNSYPRAYRDDTYVPVEGTTRSELYDLYYEFGYSDALAVDRQSLSYVSQIAPGVRLLALNSDGAEQGGEKGIFDARLFEWTKRQIDDAKKNNCFVFFINHYPIIPPCPMFELVTDAKIKNWHETAAFFADNGVPLAITGHMHTHSINRFVSESGNTLYDICTSALVGSPARYRKVTVTGGSEINVKSFDVPPFEWDMRGMTNREYFDSQFSTMIKNTIEHILTEKLFLRPLKKLVMESDVKKVCSLLRIPVTSPLADKRFIELCTDVALSIFDGDQPYVEGTQERIALETALSKLSFFLRIAEKKLSKNGESVNLKQMILDTVGNSTGLHDNDAEFIL